uniref:Uncharacterized protein n=1 Tax=Panagrellus redivivus TaxID=6233 RepID=A0A7E4ZQ08_PANRE
MDGTWLFVFLALFAALTISWGCTKPRNVAAKLRNKKKKPSETTAADPDGPTRETGSAPTATANSILQTGPSSKEMTKTPERKAKQTTSAEQNLNKSDDQKPSKIKDFLRKKKSTSQSQENSKSKEGSGKASKDKDKKSKQSTFKKFIKRFSKESAEKSKESTEGAQTAQSIEEKDNKEREPSKKKAKGQHSKTAEEPVVETPGRDKEPASDTSPKIVSPLKVKSMGNIDVLAEQQKAWRIREIEQMPSALCEDPTQLSTSVKKENLHVKIVEERCKVYETNVEGHGGKPKNEFVTPRRKGSAPVPRAKKSGKKP